MKAIALLATIARRRRLLRLGNSVASYALSTFTTNDWDFTADNVDDATDTLTVYDTNGVLMAGASVVLTSEDTLVDAATCTLVTDDAEIETTTGIANITAHVYNAAGTPLPGIPSASLSLASTGTGNTITAVDTVTDRNGRFRWTFVSTVAEAKTLTLTAIGIVVTDTAAVTVTGTPGLITADFFSDFSFATGTGTTAKNDNGKWDMLGGTGQEVIVSTGLDFPSTNVLRLTANFSNSGFALNRVSTLPVLASGDTRYQRWYVRMTFPDDLVGNGDHPWQDGNAVGDCNYIVGVHYGSDSPGSHASDWQLGAVILINTNGTFDNGPWLDKGVTYRVETALHANSTTEYDFQMRVYDTAGTLLYTSADFPADAGGGTLATRGPWTFRTISNTNGLNCGTNDFETAGNEAWWNVGAPTWVYGYQGCFAVYDRTEASISAGAWIGAYGSVDGE